MRAPRCVHCPVHCLGGVGDHVLPTATPPGASPGLPHAKQQRVYLAQHCQVPLPPGHTQPSEDVCCHHRQRVQTGCRFLAGPQHSLAHNFQFAHARVYGSTVQVITRYSVHDLTLDPIVTGSGIQTPIDCPDCVVAPCICPVYNNIYSEPDYDLMQCSPCPIKMRTKKCRSFLVVAQPLPRR